MKSVKYYEGGGREGTWETWYENGRLQSREFYKGGVRVDSSETWYVNGRLRKKETYPNGIKDHLLKSLLAPADGTCRTRNASRGYVHVKSWHKNGQLEYEGSFESSKKVGVWKNWNENGILENEGEYKFDEYDENWRVEKNTTWKKWNEIGEYKCYIKPDSKIKSLSKQILKTL